MFTTIRLLTNLAAFALVALVSKRHMRALKTAARLGCLARLCS